MSCSWFYPPDNSSSGHSIWVAALSSSGGWIQVTADSILLLTRVPVAGYELRVTPSHGWLEFRRLDTSSGWFYSAADSSSGGLVRVAVDSILRLTRVLCFNCKLKDLFCKIHYFYGLFSTDWFQLPLIQALAAASRTLKKLQNSSCNWF